MATKKPSTSCSHTAPVTTLLAELPVGHDSRALFRQLLLWGFAMTVVGALFCQFAIHWFTS